MKKEHGVLIAGAVGLFAAVGLFVFKRILNNRDYTNEYSDYHRHFSKKQTKQEDHHGVEYLSMI